MAKTCRKVPIISKMVDKILFEGDDIQRKTHKKHWIVHSLFILQVSYNFKEIIKDKK